MVNLLRAALLLTLLHYAPARVRGRSLDPLAVDKPSAGRADYHSSLSQTARRHHNNADGNGGGRGGGAQHHAKQLRSLDSRSSSIVNQSSSDAVDAAAGPGSSSTTKKAVGRAPSCGGCERRESVLSKTLRLDAFSRVVGAIGVLNSVLIGLLLFVCLAAASWRMLSRDTLVTLFYVALYLTASPTAILINKILMKDRGFGYPIMVSALGQTVTAVCATIAVRCGGVSTAAGERVPQRALVMLGGASALALVLGQYPYLYLTVAFIQMLKAFSPTYMVIFLFALGVERPSWRVIACVLGLSACTALASCGELNFNLIGFLFMVSASCSDAIRLVLAQKLLTNNKLGPVETLYFMSPICLTWMFAAAMLNELPTALRTHSFDVARRAPMLFLASGFSGAFVNFTSFLLVKRTSSMTLKTLTMARNGGLVLVSALVMDETITPLEGLGYTGLLGCFAMYTVVKAKESSGAWK